MGFARGVFANFSRIIGLFILALGLATAACTQALDESVSPGSPFEEIAAEEKTEAELEIPVIQGAPERPPQAAIMEPYERDFPIDLSQLERGLERPPGEERRWRTEVTEVE